MTSRKVIEVASERHMPGQYRVHAHMRFSSALIGPWKYEMREALRMWAVYFISKNYNESDILSCWLLRAVGHRDTQQDVLEYNVLTNPYARIALIAAGLVLDDPRYMRGMDMISVRGGHSLVLEADGWKYAGIDPGWPQLVRYTREKKE